MLEWVNTLRAAGMKLVRFAYKKDRNFGGPVMEYDELMCLPKIHMLNPKPQCDYIFLYVVS